MARNEMIRRLGKGTVLNSVDRQHAHSLSDAFGHVPKPTDPTPGQMDPKPSKTAKSRCPLRPDGRDLWGLFLWSGLGGGGGQQWRGGRETNCHRLRSQPDNRPFPLSWLKNNLLADHNEWIAIGGCNFGQVSSKMQKKKNM